MKTRYKYIHFRIIKEKPKTKVWGVFNNNEPDEPMATIEWYGSWKQYCFFPQAQDMLLMNVGWVYNDGCLSDILEFMREITKRHKKPPKPAGA